jgi:hypothetical protein
MINAGKYIITYTELASRGRLDWNSAMNVLPKLAFVAASRLWETLE